MDRFGKRILPSVALSLEARTRNLIARFADYVHAFGAMPAFNDEQLRAHMDTLALRSRLGSAAAAASSAEFTKALRRTLELWRMNTRGAKLVSLSAFEASLERCAAEVERFERDHLEADAMDAAATAEQLWSVINRLRITETGVRLVACTKALHHLLPNLVVPMDRQFTGAFFGWNTHEWQTKEERLFKAAFVVFREIAHKARPSQYVGAGWNTGPAKILDNAIVGYCRETQLDRPSRDKAVIARAKELGIYDEIVAEGKKRHEN
jgi:hypothetical protein